MDSMLAEYTTGSAFVTITGSFGPAGNTNITAYHTSGSILDNCDIVGRNGTSNQFDGGQNANLAFFDWSGDSKPYYSLAMHNFLAEVPNFFLEESQYTTFISAPQSEFIDFKGGEKYYMDIVLRKPKDMVMYEGPAAHQFYGIGLGATGSARGMHYGPNLQWTSENIGGGAASNYNTNVMEFKRNLSDPAPAAYTPPYFYGTSIARVEFDPLTISTGLGTSVPPHLLLMRFSKAQPLNISTCVKDIQSSRRLPGTLTAGLEYQNSEQILMRQRQKHTLALLAPRPAPRLCTFHHR